MADYLLMEESTVGNLTTCIISFWVKCSETGAEEKIDSGLLPPSIDRVVAANQVAFDGGSYYSGFNRFGASYHAAHIWCYPFPGPDSDGPTSWKDEIVPFLTLGDPELKFHHTNWNLKTLNTIWLFGKGGVPQELVAQYPEKGEEIEGIVPPSCVGIRQGELRVILQTSSRAKYTACAWAQSKSQTIHISTPISCQNVNLNPHPCSEPEGWVDFSTKQPVQPNQFTGYNFSYTDVSGLECMQHPEAFIMDSGVHIADGNWHHVLISVDLSGKAAAGGQDSYIDFDHNDKPIKPPEPSEDVINAKGEIKAESTSTEDGKQPPLPGTWGQYSGIDGEYALAPLRCVLSPEGPNGTYTYEQLACYGKPFEDVGQYGYADGGTITSTCWGWLAIDDISLSGASLNHHEAYNNCKFLDGFDAHAMAPPNAFLIPGAEIRAGMTTNMTGWERDYRTLLGGFNGPAAKIQVTTEKRRLDYPRPSYEFNGGSISVGHKPFAIPGGPEDLWGRERNYDVILADLQIWTGKWIDLNQESRRRLFVTEDGEPAPIARADKHLGKPSVRLHWATNWIKGNNTGSSGGRTTGPGAGTDPKNITTPRGQFKVLGKKPSRSLPDPHL